MKTLFIIIISFLLLLTACTSYDKYIVVDEVIRLDDVVYILDTNGNMYKYYKDKYVKSNDNLYIIYKETIDFPVIVKLEKLQKYNDD